MEDGWRERWKMEGGKIGMRKCKDMILRPLPYWLCFFSTVADQEAFRIFFMSCTSERHGGRRCALPPNPPPAFFKLLMFHTHLCMQTLYAKTLSLSISFRPSIALSIYYISRFLIYPNIPVSLHHSSLSCLFDSQSFVQCSRFCPPNAMGGEALHPPPQPPSKFGHNHIKKNQSIHQSFNQSINQSI